MRNPIKKCFGRRRIKTTIQLLHQLIVAHKESSSFNRASYQRTLSLAEPAAVSPPPSKTLVPAFPQPKNSCSQWRQRVSTEWHLPVGFLRPCTASCPSQ